MITYFLYSKKEVIPMRLRNKKGFTLIEVIVVAGIIAILAGILVPLIFKEIDESKKTRAWADIRSISSAMFVMKKDTGYWPIKDDVSSYTCTLLNGAGNQPQGTDTKWPTALAGNGGLFDNHLMTNAFGYNNWQGPYIAGVTADPWGNQYLSNIGVMAIQGTTPCWIISAGPNGTLETAESGGSLGGDDIGLRIR
jgi:prepilin-type N-terminal cleavage/methylation domain-containing protein